MNIEDLRTGGKDTPDQGETVIVNPNLRRKMNVSQSEQEKIKAERMKHVPDGADVEKDSAKVGRDLGNGRREFVPESAGIYSKQQEEIPDDVTRILDSFDKEYLPKKIEEIEQFNAALDAAGELTEEEVLQLQGKEYITKAIEDPRRISALKTHEISEEETRERYMKEQELLAKKDAEEAKKKVIDYNPDNYGTLPGMEDEEEKEVIGTVEDMANPVLDMDDEDENIIEEDEVVEDIPTEPGYTESEESEDVEETEESDEDDGFVLPSAEYVDAEYKDEVVEDEDDEDTEYSVTAVDYPDQETDDQILERFKKSIREKIKPVTKTFDISTYTVATKATPFSNSVQQKTNHYRRAKWALMSTGRPITMRSFKSTEIDEMSSSPRTDSRYMNVKRQYQILYNHIEDAKPSTVEEWAKMNSFLDLEHIWFAVYRSCYEGANYIPRDCTDREHCKNVFLSDDTPIIDMVKFKDKNAKKKFQNIMNSEAGNSGKMYVSEITPISDDYAIAFREPSIYNIVFESALLEEKFLNDNQDMISVMAYIDNIYKIDHEHRCLEPISVPVFEGNVQKTFKARIKTYSKILDTLSSDQYRLILTFIDEINKHGDELTYVYPEATCPKCKKVVPESSQSPQNMVFLRHQLVTLAI